MKRKTVKQLEAEIIKERREKEALKGRLEEHLADDKNRKMMARYQNGASQ